MKALRKLVDKVIVPEWLTVRYSFSGNSPFEKAKTSQQTPFGSTHPHQTWKSPSPPSTPSFTSPPKQEQKMTPLTQSQAPVQKEVQTSHNPPQLKFDFTREYLQNERTDSNKPPQQKVPETNEQMIMSDIGLNRYLTRVYLSTGLSFSIALAAALSGTYIPHLSDYLIIMAFGSGLVSFLFFNGAYYMKPTTLTYTQSGQTIFKTKNSFDRLAITGCGCVFLGLTASPLLLELSQPLIFMTIGITLSLFGGASVLGLILPRSFLKGYGSIIFGGTMGLLSLKFALMATTTMLTSSGLDLSMTSTESMLGIIFFSALAIYDTHMAINRYNKGDADHLGASIQILLDLWNLIIRIAKEILKNKTQSKKK